MTVKRLRGDTLQRIRALHFRAQPLCVMCEAKGRITAAQELDHIVALVNGGTNDHDNLQSLCVACHVEKTAADLGRAYVAPVGADGWPVA